MKKYVQSCFCKIPEVESWLQCLEECVRRKFSNNTDQMPQKALSKSLMTHHHQHRELKMRPRHSIPFSKSLVRLRVYNIRDYIWPRLCKRKLTQEVPAIVRGLLTLDGILIGNTIIVLAVVADVYCVVHIYQCSTPQETRYAVEISDN